MALPKPQELLVGPIDNLSRMESLPDPMSLAPDATNIKEMIQQGIATIFGGDPFKSIEGYQIVVPPLVSPTVPDVPKGVPGALVPIEIAGVVGGVGILAATLVPLIQLLMGILQFLDGLSLKSLDEALNHAGKEQGGKQADVAKAFRRDLNLAVGELGTELGKTFAGLHELSQDEVGRLLAKPAPWIPGLTSPESGVLPDAATTKPSWAGTIDKVIRSLPIVPVVVPPVTGPNPNDFPNQWVDFTPELLKQGDLPAAAFSEATPKIVFVANPGRAVPDPLNAVNNPGQAIANAMDLAKDIAAVAAQQEEVGKALDNLSDATEELLSGDPRLSLYSSLLAILRSVALYNLTVDSDLNPTSVSGAALRYPQRTLVPTRIAEGLNPESHIQMVTKVRGEDIFEPEVELINSLLYEGATFELGTDFYFSESTIHFLNDNIPDGEAYVAFVQHRGAFEDALAEAEDIVASFASLGAFPGNLIHAAFGDDVPSVGVESVLAGMPSAIAGKIGHGVTTVSLVHKLVNSLEEGEDSLSLLPDLYIGVDPEVVLHQKTLAAFCALVVWIDSQTNIRANLTPYESLVSTLGLYFIDAVQSNTALGYATLGDRVRAGKLDAVEQLAFRTLCVSYDQAFGSVTVGSSAVPGVVYDFLTHLFTVPLRDAEEVADVATAYREEMLIIGKRVGGDLIYAASVAGVLQRCLVILLSDITDEEASERVKKALKIGDGFYKLVTNLPNKGCLGQIEAVLS